MQADGSGVVQLTRNDDVRRITELPDWDTYPAVSPDGSQLLWRRIAPTGGKSESGRNSEVFWMNLVTGEQRNVTGDRAYDGWLAWSPDGRRIAFASNRANAVFDGFDIYVANADGSNPVRVTFGDGVEGRGSWTKPSFSADGLRILCTRAVGSSVDIFVITLKPRRAKGNTGIGCLYLSGNRRIHGSLRPDECGKLGRPAVGVFEAAAAVDRERQPCPIGADPVAGTENSHRSGRHSVGRSASCVSSSQA